MWDVRVTCSQLSCWPRLLGNGGVRPSTEDSTPLCVPRNVAAPVTCNALDAKPPPWWDTGGKKKEKERNIGCVRGCFVEMKWRAVSRDADLAAAACGEVDKSSEVHTLPPCSCVATVVVKRRSCTRARAGRAAVCTPGRSQTSCTMVTKPLEALKTSTAASRDVCRIADCRV